MCIKRIIQMSVSEMSLEEKYQKLVEYIRSLGKVAVAFSSGVDSTFLLYAAKEALQDYGLHNASKTTYASNVKINAEENGLHNASECLIAVTANSGVFARREYDEAIDFCKANDIKHIILDIDEFKTEGFADNPKNRCYLCKKTFFSAIMELAKEHGIVNVIEGSNVDDDDDYRPGMQAIKELGVISPLKACGFTKDEIRQMSRILHLPTSDKPSFACLASRIPYGETITRKKLAMVEEAENYLFDKGFVQLRVRIHGDMARIELLPKDIERFAAKQIREDVYKKFKQIGFSYVTMDIKGFRSGSLNEVLV